MINRIANITKKQNSASSLLNLSTDPKVSINKVNNYFANVGKSLASNILHPKTLPAKTQIFKSSNYVNPNSMVMVNIENTEIERIILGLKDKCAIGSDGISTEVVKSARHVLIPCLRHIFNLSLDSGIFPSAFKKAIVHPIFKNGDRHSVSNYRPISVLSVFSKIFEKILNEKLVDFLNSNDFFSNNQFGFRKSKSTEHAVLELSEQIIKNFDKRLKTVGVFLDLSKAFDTVSIPILLSKLLAIGIRGIVFDLFKSYLTNRTQTVVIDNIKSTEEDLNFGVPQGSVLGPTLFLIYLNDLCNLNLPYCKVTCYADDTSLLIHGRNWEETRARAEAVLTIVMNWLASNLLTLNLSKTLFVTFAPTAASYPPSSFSITAHTCLNNVGTHCDCISLQRSTSTKYLGVMINSTMNWKPHIKYTATKLRKLIFIFKSLRNIVDFKYLKNVYFALAQSLLTYCISSWGGCAKSHMIRLERAQRAVLKVIAGKPRRYPTADLFTLCQVLSVRQLFILQTVIKKHTELEYVEPSNSKRRRDLVCPTLTCRTAIAGTHYHYISPKLYNSVNRHLNIYPLTLYQCKTKCLSWLLTLRYDETEELLQNFSWK